MKLSQKVVDTLTLPPGKAEAFTWDDDLPGLGVRLQGKRATWIVQSRVAGGRQQRVTLGPVAGLTLKDARRRAGKVLADAKDGKSASGERKEARQRAETTVGDVLDLYLKRYAEPNQRPKTLAGTKRYLDVAWEPIRAIPAATVTRSDVATQLAKIAVDSGPIAGNRALSALSSALSWAMREGIAVPNPCAELNKPGTERKRKRTLTDVEIKLVWRATTDGRDFSRIVRLLLLTGQRREEVAAMVWSELDLDKAIWTLPEEPAPNQDARTKNGMPHDIPLSGQALALIGVRPEGSKKPYVFGRLERSSFSGFDDAKKALDVRVARLRAGGRLGRPLAEHEAPEEADALPHWTLHDLRRSAVTGMCEIGIGPHIAEAAVNHISGHKAGVAGVYNKAVYASEKRAALQRWADHVERLVSGEPGGNVVTLARVG